MSPAAVPIATQIEREILDLYPGYHRVDEALGMTVVHRVAIGKGWYGDTTLIDASFGTDWR